MYVIKPANLLLLSFVNQVAELFISDFYFSIVTDTKKFCEKNNTLIATLILIFLGRILH